jgi:localization factor PodJL
VALDKADIEARSAMASEAAEAFEEIEEEPRPSPIERVRSLYSKRKRPILLGLAAVVLALGTIQVAKLASPDRGVVNEEPTGGAEAPAATEAAPDAPGPQSAAPATEPPQALAAPQTKPAEIASLASPAATEAAAPDNVGSLGTGFGTLEEGVAAGDARALYEKASAEVDGRNPQRDLAKAVELYILSAEKGFAPAQYRLGSMFAKGLGIEKDVEQARQWYEKAAARGNLKAMHNMAVLYAEGAFGGQADYAKAAEWFRSAAEHGLRDSEYNYAVLVARGLGTATDLPQAYKWFALAAAQGDEDAASKRDEVAKRLDQATLDRLKNEVANFVPAQAPAAANEATLPSVSWATQTPGGA